MIDTARARAYNLLGSLLLGERDAVALARATSPLGDLLRGQHETEIAAEHHGTFALEAFPYAGVFSEPEALIGGRIANRVDAVAREVGQSKLVSSESPDHVGHIFRIAAALLIRDSGDRALDLVRTCLLPWLPPWAAAVSRQRAGFWPYVVELSLELVNEHVGETTSVSVELASPFSLSESIGIAEIASALTIPVIAGAFVGREDIRSLGRRLGLPTGFGSRRLMLTNLLRAAADYQRGPELLAALAGFFDAEADRIRTRWSENSSASEKWARRSRETACLLLQMNDSLAGAQAAVS